MDRKNGLFLFLLTLSVMCVLAFPLPAHLLSGLALVSYASADTIPGGNVSGTWYEASSPYYIAGSITIPVGNTLTIEPGVLVNFLGHYSFTVNGVLEASGTASDSIHFFSEDAVAGWSGIVCGDVSDSQQLSYCTVSYADCGYEAWASFGGVSISDCRFSGNNRAIMWAGSSSLQVDDCVFQDNSSTEYGGAVTVWLANGPVGITGCLFENNSASSFGGAVVITQWADNDIIISDCSFIDNTAEDWGGAIVAYEMSYPASLIVENCTFTENTANGIDYTEGGGAIWASNIPDFDVSYCSFSDNWSYYGAAINLTPVYGNSDLELDHCTFLGNEIFGTAPSNTMLDVGNCIFTGAEYAIANHENITLTVSYSDFHNNVVDIEYPPPGFGVLDRVNLNGDSCDCYYDIFMDPMFVDPTSGDLYLLAGSPCIDAGDPTFPYDPDGTITDMGRYYFNQTGVGGGDQVVVPSGQCMLSCSPNPCEQTLNVHFDVTGQSASSLSVYGLDGRLLLDMTDCLCGDTGDISLDVSGMCSGVYLCRLVAGDASRTTAFVLMR
jgi:hypothetical protein